MIVKLESLIFIYKLFSAVQWFFVWPRQNTGSTTDRYRYAPKTQPFVKWHRSSRFGRKGLAIVVEIEQNPDRANFPLKLKAKKIDDLGVGL